MRFSFSAEYNIGDKVKILAGEHNDNWEGRIGKIAEIGIDLSQIVYLVEFRREKFKPCFKVEDLKPMSGKNKREGFREISLYSKYEVGDKVKVLPTARSLKTDIDLRGEVCSVFIDNHMSLEEINYCYEHKIGWFKKKENEHMWFNNMVVYLNPSEDRPEIWRGKVGEIANIEFDGTEEKPTIIYGVKYRNETSVPCFREQDLVLAWNKFERK
ncbi:MAG: hypothetical protein IJG33_12200 [Selenomonadaceae bacterium]|nr:hypothetical protein [Selenomonadaceae bacterium]